MKKTLIWAVTIIVVIILFPKPYNSGGGMIGELPDPLRKCFGYNFSIGGNYPDATFTLYCVGIPYISKSSSI